MQEQWWQVLKISYVVEILLGDSEKLGLDSLEGKGGSGEGSSESSWTWTPVI